MYPTDRKYTKDHEWVRVDGDVATIGITDFAQQELGDIVFVELPDSGATFAAGDVIGTIESVKAVSEIFAPLAGEVVEVNAPLGDSPEKVNQDAHGDGWYCKIKLTAPEELDDLLDAAAYEQSIAS